MSTSSGAVLTEPVPRSRFLWVRPCLAPFFVQSERVPTKKPARWRATGEGVKFSLTTILREIPNSHETRKLFGAPPEHH